MSDNSSDNTSTNSNQPASVYLRGARDGIVMGLYMLVIFLVAAYQVFYPMLSLVFIVLALGVPPIAYFMMRRDFYQLPQMRFFSAVWMHGISIFLFGSLILSAGIFVFLKWVEPYYFVNLVDMAIEAYNSLGNEQMTELAHQLERIKDSGLLPSAGQFAFNIIWSVVFSGCILTMILTWVLRLRHKNLLQQANN